MGGVIFDIFTEADDEIIDGPGVGVFVDVPDRFEDRFAADGATLILDEVAQEAGFHLGERDAFAFGDELE